MHRGGRGTLQFLRQDLAPCTGALQLSGNQVVLAGHEEALRLGKPAETLLFEFSHDSLGRMAPQKFGASYRVFGNGWSPTTRPWPWKPL